MLRLAHSSLDAIKGSDTRDPTSLSEKSCVRITAKIGERQKPRSLRIGVPIEYNIQELSSVVREGWFRALNKLQEQGHTIHRVSLPATKHALSAYYVLAPAEASSNLAKYDGVRYGFRGDADDGAGGVLYAKSRGQGFGEEVKRRILLGAYSLSAEAIDNYFVQAQKVRRLVQQDFDRVFALPHPLLATPAMKKEGNGVDVLISPTAPTLPPPLEAVENQTPLDAYMNDVFTVPASLAGLPAISMPISMQFDRPIPGLGYQYDEKEWSHPVGVQVVGQYGDDDLVFDVAKLLE
jgi:aspartyl-tRNA(Asn)/glutamyl-tRNA(Gln) amidotransferase subunit A